MTRETLDTRVMLGFHLSCSWILRYNLVFLNIGMEIETGLFWYERDEKRTRTRCDSKWLTMF